ncbi:MAG: hypothetical protein NVV59_17140 [Chitinophagaceae bacterium]|nr:hypothetical protein [Chitinophagaceae bacterium]
MKLAAFSLSLLLPAFVFAQEKKSDKKWDVNAPEGTYKEVQFTTTEGTWMNLDLSPDGKTIVFDLLGDIYSIPVTGGKSNAVTRRSCN